MNATDTSSTSVVIKGVLDCSERALENAVEIMSARNKRATVHALRSQRTSTCSLPKSCNAKLTGVTLSSGSERRFQ